MLKRVKFDSTRRTTKDFKALLVIYLLGAFDLPAKDITGCSDPFVTFRHKAELATSRIVEKSLNPLFDEYLVLFLVDYHGAV